MTEARQEAEADTEEIETADAVREVVSTGTATEEAGTGEDTAEDGTVADRDPGAGTMEEEGATMAAAANGSRDVIETPCWEATLMTGTAGRGGTQAVLPVGVGAAIRQIGASSAAEGRGGSLDA